MGAADARAVKEIAANSTVQVVSAKPLNHRRDLAGIVRAVAVQLDER
jgi:hypothetical protein